ncbi:MAG: hypothetical protein JSV86_17555 [Gemmatimonadota bacterium]|nr:MAG: hypothetical protein JSV86_17555 [Gemmatimonadota bacterium]
MVRLLDRQYSTWLAGLAALSLLGCAERGERASTDLSDEEKAGGLAVVCYQADIGSLNAFVSPELAAADIQQLLFTPLVLYGESGEYLPYLATEWLWEDDGRRLVLNIRSDVVWHDGTRLGVEDVAWTLRAAADPEYAYWGGGDFLALRDVVVRDSTTIEIGFSEPMVAGLEPFVGLPILPRHLLGDVPAAEFAQAEYHRAPVGSGPFSFAGRRPDGAVMFDRFDDFPQELGRPYLDRIVLRPILEATTILAELETGGTDLCVVGSGLATRAQGSGRLQVVPLEPAQTQVIPLNTRQAPLDDARVRRAISAALRRSEIAAATSPVARAAVSPLPEASPYFDPQFVQPDADRDLASSLLDSAGWREFGDGRRNAQGEELRFTLVAPQGMETSLTVVQAQLRRAGVAMELRQMEWTSYVDLLQSPDDRPAAMALGFAPEKIFNPASDLYSEFHSEGFSNLGSYSSVEVDSLLELLRAPLAADERREIYSEIQRRVADDVPMLFVINVPRLAVVGSRLQGVEVDLNGPFAFAWRWWIAPAQRRVGG